MKRCYLVFLALIILFSCSGGKDQSAKNQQATTEQSASQSQSGKSNSYAPGDNSTDAPGAHQQDFDVVVMPMASVDGSYATCNYQNRHYFAALVGAMLETFGDISTPDRNMIIREALERKRISGYGRARRDSAFSLSLASSFTEFMNPEYVVLPSLYGDDDGDYKFNVRIFKPSEGNKVLWEKSWEENGEVLDFALTLDLYEKAAFAASEYILGKEINTNNFPSKEKKSTEELIREARAARKKLDLKNQVKAVNAFCRALKNNPGDFRLWADLSETYSVLARNIGGTGTEIGLEMPLRAMVTAAVARKLNPENKNVLRASYLSSRMNTLPKKMKEYLKKYFASTNEDLAKFWSADDPQKGREYFEKLKSQPQYGFIIQGSVSNQEAINRLNDLWMEQPESTFLCNEIRKMVEQQSFGKSENYIYVQTYNTQKQFLDFMYKRMNEYSEKPEEQRRRLVEGLAEVVSSAATVSDREPTSPALVLEKIRRNYFGRRNGLYLTSDKIPFRILKVCHGIQKDAEKHLKKRKPFPENSLELSERDILALWQRELLRGPLSALYIVGHYLSVLEVSKEAIPQLVKLYPEDMLVQNAGFKLIYGKTGYGPDGDRYLKAMYDIDMNNPNVIKYQMKNLLDSPNKSSGRGITLGLIYSASSPQDSNVIRFCYDYFSKLAHNELAAKMARRYVNCYPDSTWGKRKTFEMKKQTEMRQITLDELESLFPDNIEDPYTLWTAAGLYRENGHFEKALELYSKAFEQIPEEDDLALELGYSWRLAGRPEKYVQVTELSAKANKGNIKSCILYNKIGNYYYFQGKTEWARKYYNKGYDVDSWQGNSIIGQAYLHYADGDLDAAKKEFERSYNRYYQDFAPSRYARILLKKDELEKARDYIQEKIMDRRTRGYYELRNLRAEYYYRTNQRKKAFKELHDFIDVFRSSIEGRAALGRLYLRAGDIDGGVRMLRKEISGVSMSDWKEQPMYELLARAYIMKGDLDAAKKWVDKCRLFALTHENTFRLLGLYHWKQGNIEKARDYLVKELNTAPSNTTARACLVGLEREQGNIDKAIEQGEKGMKCCILHDDTELYYQLAKAYLAKGMKKEAKKLTGRIIMIDGKNSRIGKKLDELDI